MKYLQPTDCPFYLITRTSLTVTAVLKKELANAGLEKVKPAYLGVLMCLWADEGINEMLSKLGNDDGMRLIDLGRCAGLEPSTMTGLIDRMERDGLVCRLNDPRDRRVQKINLTEDGIHAQEKVLIAVNHMLEKVFAGIDPEEMKITKKVLGHVLTNTSKGNR